MVLKIKGGRLKGARVFILASPDAVLVLPDSGDLLRLNTAVATAGSASARPIVFANAGIQRGRWHGRAANHQTQNKTLCGASSCRFDCDNFASFFLRFSAIIRRWVSPCLYCFYSTKAMRIVVLAAPQSRHYFTASLAVRFLKTSIVA